MAVSSPALSAGEAASNAPKTATLDFGSHPPKPKLTLRVGVTGHRPKPDKLPARSFDFVQRRLAEVFAALDSLLVEASRAEAQHYSDGPHRVRLVSGLSEGADQFAVRAMPRNWALDAILPFPRESYLEDFTASALGDGRDVTEDFLACLGQAETVVELPDDPIAKRLGLTRESAEKEYARRRAAGYARLGGFLLRQIDILVAVWDGKPEAGEGGTAEVVRAAVDARIPVVWIHSLDDSFARMIEDIDDEERVRAPDADCRSGPMQEALESIVRVPAPPESSEFALVEKEGPDAAARLGAFLAEHWPTASLCFTYDLFKRWVEGKSPRWRIPAEPQSGYFAWWARLDGDGPPAGELSHRMGEALLPRYAWADALAVQYSHRYRSAYFDTYVLAAAAVFIAMCSIFSRNHNVPVEWQLGSKAALVTLEIVVIATIVMLVSFGRGGRWQDKWIEYRALAELLLNARFLAYVGEHGRAHSLGNLEPASSAWFLWYLRATIREIGLPKARLDGGYQRKLLGSVDRNVISDQANWHLANAKTLNRMHGRLHHWGDLCFLGTIVVLVAFFVFWLLWNGLRVCESDAFGAWLVQARFAETTGSGLKAFANRWETTVGGYLLWYKDIVVYLAAALPALGAALAGIRETGDFGKVAAHSARTAAGLLGLQSEVARAKGDLALAETGDILLATAQALTEDLVAWQSVYGHKRLELP